MKLSVVRSGGFAGLTRTWEAEIPACEAERWLILMKSDAGPERPVAAASDSFSYTVSLGGLTTELTEHAITPAWQELFDVAKNQP
ncbi:protealysin inhibitor emfourin [Arthrobacter roseus]|uniref:protealysin inhibitor emfourin n=1 Tax=Arthrobacter roseus TaxID=136274 RepID=UPI001964DFA0|nr:protealysin inhibitor emfourin [Arthrobacter roseus]MBM7849720.1 hypothetical protein [Arthrobacter roseus]